MVELQYAVIRVSAIYARMAYKILTYPNASLVQIYFIVTLSLVDIVLLVVCVVLSRVCIVARLALGRPSCQLSNLIAAYGTCFHTSIFGYEVNLDFVESAGSELNRDNSDLQSEA